MKVTNLKRIIEELEKERERLDTYRGVSSTTWSIAYGAAIRKLETWQKELNKERFKKLCCDEKANGWTLAMNRILGDDNQDALGTKEAA
jgi:hypothetical protein